MTLLFLSLPFLAPHSLAARTFPCGLRRRGFGALSLNLEQEVYSILSKTELSCYAFKLCLFKLQKESSNPLPLLRSSLTAITIQL